MYADPMELGRSFPIRKAKKQKQAFRGAVEAYARELGYSCRMEKCSFGGQNIIIGNDEKAEYLVTAHYDTCAAMPFPNLLTPCSFLPFILYQLFTVVWMLAIPVIPGFIAWWFLRDSHTALLVWYGFFWVNFLLMMAGPANKSNVNDNTSGVVAALELARSLPENLRDKVSFVLFDLEEAGFVGSSAYRKSHKARTDRQLILNLDCVGDGDFLMMFPTSKLKKDTERMTQLRKICGSYGEKSLSIREKGFSVYPSDQKCFPKAVGICALRKSPFGLYMSRIHTKRDTVMEQTNINILRAALSSLICRTVKEGEKT